MQQQQLLPQPQSSAQERTSLAIETKEVKGSHNLPFISTLSPKLKDLPSEYNQLRVNNQLQRLLSSVNDLNKSSLDNYNNSIGPLGQQANQVQPRKSLSKKASSKLEHQNLQLTLELNQKSEQLKQVQSFQFQAAHQLDSAENQSKLRNQQPSFQDLVANRALLSPKIQSKNLPNIVPLREVYDQKQENASMHPNQNPKELKEAKKQLLQGIESRKTMLSQLNSNPTAKDSRQPADSSANSLQQPNDRNQSALFQEQKFASQLGKKVPSLEINDSYSQQQHSNYPIQMDSFLLISPTAASQPLNPKLSNQLSQNQSNIKSHRHSNNNNNLQNMVLKFKPESGVTSLARSPERNLTLSGQDNRGQALSAEQVAKLNESSVQQQSSTHTSNTSYIVSLPFIKSSKEQTNAKPQSFQMQNSNYGLGSGMTMGLVGPLGALGSSGFKDLGISHQEHEVQRQLGRVSATPNDGNNSLHVIDEGGDRRRQKMIIQTDSNFQKVKMRKKQQLNQPHLTQRQLVQAALLDRNAENQNLQKHERFINNLHSNLTVNGQRQEIFANQSPEPNDQQASKRKVLRQVTKSQEPLQSLLPEAERIRAQGAAGQTLQQAVANSQSNTHRLHQSSQNSGGCIAEEGINEKPIVRIQYNHQFSNIKNSARGSNALMPSFATEAQSQDQSIKNDYQLPIFSQGIMPFNERREALRNKFSSNQEMQSFLGGQGNALMSPTSQAKAKPISVQNQEAMLETNTSPKNDNEFSGSFQPVSKQYAGISNVQALQQHQQKFVLSQAPYESLIQRSNIIITEKGQSNASSLLPTGLSFASPSLEYKKKKRDYYPSTSNNANKNANHLMPVQQMQAHQQYISLSKANQLINVAQEFKSQLQNGQLKHQLINGANINQLVHQLNMSRIGNPHLSFAQVLKNMNSKVNYNQVPVTNIDTFENIRKDFNLQFAQNSSSVPQHQKQLQMPQDSNSIFSYMARSPSQEQLETMTYDTVARVSSLDRVEVNQLLDQHDRMQAKHQNVMSSEKKRSHIQMKKNSDLMNGQTYSHVQKRKNSFSQNQQQLSAQTQNGNNPRLLNADELYEMAKKLKKQSKVKQGVAEYQQLTSQNPQAQLLQQMQLQQSFNRSNDSIQQLTQQQMLAQQQNLLGYLNQRLSLGNVEASSKNGGASSYTLSLYNQVPIVNANGQSVNPIADIPGALNIQRLRTKQVRHEGMDTYQMRQRDMQLVQKYSKKGQNLLQSYEDQLQNSALGDTRNQRSQLQSSKSLTKDPQNKSIHAKVNQSVDLSGSMGGGGMLASTNNQSDAQLMSIQEMQPVLRSEDKRGTASTTIREGKSLKAQDEKQAQSRTGGRNGSLAKAGVDGGDSVAEADSQEEGNTSSVVKPGLGGNLRNNNFQLQQKPAAVQQKGWQSNKVKKQQELRNQDLDKLMYGYLWERDARSQVQNPSTKKKAEIPFFADLVQPDEFQTHAVNKTLKLMTAMSNLLFRTKEYGGSVQTELLSRCTRFFGISVPKQYKGELAALMKSKEFLTQAKEKMHLTLFANINKANQLPPSEDPAQSQPQPKYIIGGGNNHMLVKSVFKTRQWWVQAEKESFDDCSFIWTQWLKERHVQALVPLEKRSQASNNQDPQEESLHVTRLYNKMQANHNLSDKKRLFDNMREYYGKRRGFDPFKVLPLTFVIENGLNDEEFDKFETHFNQIASQNNEGGQAVENVWIIKPGEDTNRGSGIIVSKDFNEIKQLVRDKASRGVDKTAILQKYIENPLLINKRKFDIRCYGMLTSVNGNLMGYFYNDGYLRTSCKEFSVQNLSNKFIHLTNDAIQKNSDDYGKFENANKLSFQDFDKYFENNGDHDLKFLRDFLPQIKAIIRDSFDAVVGKIDPDRRLNSFEIFGYDFMITDNYELKLIEANTNPSIEICCPLLARIVPNLLDSAFKIAIDPLFPPPANKKTLGAWGSSNEILNELKFELVFQAPPPTSQSAIKIQSAREQTTTGVII